MIAATLWPFDLMIRRDFLPNEKKAHEISRRDRLDLFAKRLSV